MMADASDNYFMINNKFIGLMSGTSVDAVDVVLVEFNTATPQLLATYAHPWPLALRETLLTLSQHTCEKSTLQAIATLDILTGEIFAQAVLTLLERESIPAHIIRAIGSPGQTLYHSPNSIPPYTWQLGDPNVIAQLTGIPTVADFRRRDMAAGGQGAPLAPSFHNAQFRSEQETRCVLNIGGIANITVLPANQDKSVIGFDTGPGNALLDAHIEQHHQRRMDVHAEWASGGQVHLPLLNKLLTDPYFLRSPPKTSGRDYFNLAWLAKHTAHFDLTAQDIQATLCQLTIESIVQAIQNYTPQRVLVCGGGVHNPLLMQGLAQKLKPCIVESTAAHDVDPDWVEAISFAWFAKQRLDNQPSNLPSVTGAKQAVVLGGIYC
jgi:anhydro-N-acetylmuramic acid kinase